LAALLEGSAAVNAIEGILKVSYYNFRRIARVVMEPLLDRTVANQFQGKEGQEVLSWQALAQNLATNHHHVSHCSFRRRPTSFRGSAARDAPAENGPHEGGAPPSARSFLAGARVVGLVLLPELSEDSMGVVQRGFLGEGFAGSAVATFYAQVAASLPSAFFVGVSSADVPLTLCSQPVVASNVVPRGATLTGQPAVEPQP